MGKGEEEMSEQYEFVTIVANTRREFNEQLNHYGQDGYKLNRFYYRPKDDYRKQEREFIAIMWRANWN